MANDQRITNFRAWMDAMRRRVRAGTRLLTLAAFAISPLWGTASYAATVSGSSVTLPSTITASTVIGPQTVTITSANSYGSTRVSVEINISNAQFIPSNAPTAQGLTSCSSITPLVTKLIYDGCTLSNSSFQLLGTTYNTATALNTGGTSITLSGSIYNPNNPSQVFETITAGAVVTSPVVNYTLTTNTSGSGTGTVTVNSSTSSFPSGTTVTLTATPATGSSFAGWSGGGCGTATTCQVTMNENKSVTATFTLTPATTYTLTTRNAGTGSGSVTVSPSASSYAAGTVVTLTASVFTNSTFAGWSGNCSGTATTCQVTMNENKTVTATFNTASPSTSSGTLRQAAVFSSASSASQSFLRFYNSGTAAGTVTITLSDYATGQSLGHWTSPSIAAGTAPQYPITTVESGLSSGTKPAFYSVTMQSTFAGTFQHVLWKPSDGTLTNLSTCDSGITAIATRLTNVHSSILGSFGYPSSIVVYNTGTTASAVSLAIADAGTGTTLGTYQTLPIPANGEQILTVSALETAAGVTPKSTISHYVVSAVGTFTGYLQHLVNNTAVGVTTDMSTVCSFPTSSTTTTPPPVANPSGS